MDAPELDEVRRQLAAGELGPARDLLDTLAADHLAAGREARAAGCLQLSATVSRLSGDRQGAIERAERAASLSVSGSDVGARIDAERHAIATELGVLAIAEALEQGGLEAVAAKLEEQGVTIDDMHSRIVDNCLKQEEQLDDPDNQCAAYMRSVFMRDHLANMHGYRRDRLSKFAEDLQEHTHPEEVRRALREPRALPAFNYKQRMLYADESDGEGEGEGEDF
jgi:hypothetical protein